MRTLKCVLPVFANSKSCCNRSINRGIIVRVYFHQAILVLITNISSCFKKSWSYDRRSNRRAVALRRGSTQFRLSSIFFPARRAQILSVVAVCRKAASEAGRRAGIRAVLPQSIATCDPIARLLRSTELRSRAGASDVDRLLFKIPSPISLNRPSSSDSQLMHTSAKALQTTSLSVSRLQQQQNLIFFLCLLGSLLCPHKHALDVSIRIERVATLVGNSSTRTQVEARSPLGRKENRTEKSVLYMTKPRDERITE